MTPAEFKAWFDGFTEGIAGRPTEKQWARICKRVKDIDGSLMLTPRYIVDTWPSIRPWWVPSLGGIVSTTTAGSGSSKSFQTSDRVTLSSGSACEMSPTALPQGATDVNFLAALGRSEFAEAA